MGLMRFGSLVVVVLEGLGTGGLPSELEPTEFKTFKDLALKTKTKVISEVIKYHQSSFRKRIYIQTDETDELKNRPSVS